MEARPNGRTIRKVMAGRGWGKKQKKIMQGKMPRKKNSCKEGKEKKFMEKEGPIVTFSESPSFRNQQYYQAQYQ